MMFLPSIFLSLSDHHLYNVVQRCFSLTSYYCLTINYIMFACVWCEVTHPLTNSNLKNNVLVPLILFNAIYE